MSERGGGGEERIRERERESERGREGSDVMYMPLYDNFESGSQIPYM